ncbi:hypothetical protein, partial [Methanorbis rubei]|uniref:hypothetical protein n=1 Tax=Methanorbis rubei TaxID=3028300 RepID=UPI0030B90EE8
ANPRKSRSLMLAPQIAFAISSLSSRRIPAGSLLSQPRRQTLDGASRAPPVVYRIIFMVCHYV